MHKLLLIFSVLLLPFATQAGYPEITGRVDDVPNGDTIYIVDTNNKRHKVYLLGVTAPNKGQPFYKTSQQHLAKLLFHRNDRVKVIIKKRTRAGNIIGTVFAAYQNSEQYADINGMMVMSGYARANVKTSKQYLMAEKIARNKKVGIWKGK